MRLQASTDGAFVVGLILCKFRCLLRLLAGMSIFSVTMIPGRAENACQRPDTCTNCSAFPGIATNCTTNGS